VSQLVTGEAVVLDIRTAGVPSRALAALIDGVVQGILMLLGTFLVGVAAQWASPAATGGLLIAVVLMVWLGYPVALETLMRGRTLGKMALGLRVVRDDGGATGFRHAITRGLLGLFVEKPGITLGFAGLLTALLNERGKRLGDLLAGTVVVQERVGSSRTDTIVMPAPLAGWAQSLDLSALPDDLAESARAYVGRVHSLTPQAQADLGGRLASAVAAVVTPEPPPGVPPWAYLSAVLAERRRRSAYAEQPLPPAPPTVVAHGAPPAPEPPAPPPPTPSTPFAPPG
jgi:uncharacterized RDD family membrane protein YckC